MAIFYYVTAGGGANWCMMFKGCTACIWGRGGSGLLLIMHITMTFYDALKNINIASTRLVTIDIKHISFCFLSIKKKNTVTFVACCSHAQARTHYIKSLSLAVSAVRRPQDIDEFNFM